MKKIIYIMALFIVLSICDSRAFGQAGKSIKGVVSDAQGPIRFATIYEKEFSTNGIQTDENGNFTLKLRGNQNIIVVKFVGYITKEIDVSNNTSFSVTLLEDAIGLEQVVVLGLGQKTQKVTLTGAVSSLSGDKIRQSPSASLQNTLAGRLPGFFSQQRSGQPGEDGAAFQIRGRNTYAGGTTPLVIVDDVEVSADQISMLDANEVENVTILKDASTTAVYGVKGSNGVIIITTRRGQAGKPTLNFKNETGLQMPTQRPVTNDGYVTLNLLRESLAGNYVNPLTNYSRYFSGENLQHYLLNDDPYNYPNVKWWDELLKDVSIQNRINFDISGGNNTVKYFTNLAYLYQGGLYKDFSDGQGYQSNYMYNRYNFRSNVDITPTKTLKIRLDLSGRFGVTNEPNDAAWNGGAGTFQYLWNGELTGFEYPVYWPNGLIASSTNPSVVKPNPVANLMYSGYERTYENNISAVANANQELNFITKGLSVNALLSFASDYNFNRSLTRSSSEILAYTYNTTTKQYQSVVTDLYRMGILSRGYENLGTNRILNLRGGLNYNRAFGKHNVTAMVLYNRTKYTDDGATLTDVTRTVAADPSKVLGYTGRVGYSFNNKYLVDITAAYNGSDRFGSGQRKQWFPAASIGWNVSEEGYFKNNVKFINFLKLRASYGLTGNDDLGTNTLSYRKSYAASASGIIFGETPQSYSGMIEPTLGNTNITWMTTEDFNAGIDIKLFGSKISITADYFNKLTKDILTTPGLIPSTFGATLPQYNLGKVSNKGYELDVTYNGKVGKDINVFVNANVSYAKNIVEYRDEPAYLYDWLALTGKQIGAQFQYTALGFYNSLNELYTSPKLASTTLLSTLQLGSVKYADLNGDGIIDANDRGYIGNNNPNYAGGLSFGFSYKGFDISTVFAGSFDYIININRGSLSYARPERVSVAWNASRWTPANPKNASFPDLSSTANNGFAAANSTLWYTKGDFIRWKTIEIGYLFPSSFAKKLRVNQIRVFANGYNLGLLYTKLPSFVDPESALSSSAGEYPQQRVLNFGLKFGL